VEGDDLREHDLKKHVENKIEKGGGDALRKEGMGGAGSRNFHESLKDGCWGVPVKNSKKASILRRKRVEKGKDGGGTLDGKAKQAQEKILVITCRDPQTKVWGEKRMIKGQPHQKIQEEAFRCRKGGVGY